MEGILWKWTNYWGGWQQRFFILDSGILAYYKSQEEVGQGSKGSLKMAVCEIHVHHNDQNRFDLIIPGEQYFYLRAPSAQERQQWLVALGSSKATLANISQIESGEMSPGVIRGKKSELRLYSDLLMQQVLAVKSAAGEKPPEPQKLDDATSLLTATCDTFIKTLEECMELASATSASQRSGIEQTATNPVVPPNFTLNKRSDRRSHASGNNADKSRRRSSASESSSRNLATSSSEAVKMSTSEISKGSSGVSDSLPGASAVSSNESLSTIDFPSFFSALPLTFADIPRDKDKYIRTDQFLEVCRHLLVMFDVISATAFASVKSDINGNIRKIHQKFSVNPTRYSTLQEIVMCEISDRTESQKESATIALLWLKRALAFIREALYELVVGQCEFSDCIQHAYSKTIRPYHGWVIRGVFALASKAVPYRSDVIIKFAKDPLQGEDPRFESKLCKDITNYLKSMDEILHILDQFYKENDIDFQEVAGNM